MIPRKFTGEMPTLRTIFIHHKSTERGFNTATKCIVVFCALVIGAAAWLLNRPEHPKDPREDEEQEQYLKEWSRNHGKNEKSKVEK